MNKQKNQYLEEIINNLPRILSLFDVDSTNKSYGIGDRYYWAWGLIDFGNATFQGASNGLARLWVSGLWPYKTSKNKFLERINSIVMGASYLTRDDGSLEEAFPYEGSYCVTSLVAFDLLCTIDLLKTEVDSKIINKWINVIEPMISYLIKNDENHACISNHLATAVAALARWHELTNDVKAEKKSIQLLNRILSNQSKEGWFLEYEGFDAGYQTLCTYYLSDVHKVKPEWNLIRPLNLSIEFLSYFIHPDGSLGGFYGSRSTRFFYPGGFLELASEIPKAQVIADFFIKSIANLKTVTLSSIDEPNLIPMFNSYCLAASIFNDKNRKVEISSQIPSLSKNIFRKFFDQAGFIVDKGDSHYTIINFLRGGIVSHFVNGSLTIENTGLVFTNNKGNLGSTSLYSKKNSHIISSDNIEIKSVVTKMPKRVTDPLRFLIIRTLSISLFKYRFIREQIKKHIVKILITDKSNWPVFNIRKIYFGRELKIKDYPDVPRGYNIIKGSNKFLAIHMASQGYWQIQDED